MSNNTYRVEDSNERVLTESFSTIELAREWAQKYISTRAFCTVWVCDSNGSTPEPVEAE
jgi:hypothetical protein